MKLDGNVKTFNDTVVTSDSLDEGLINLYYSTDKVLVDLNGLKGIANGIASLDATGKVPTSQLASLPFGITYNGVDSLKILPILYPTTTPIAGDRYIATDTAVQYILITNPYTSVGNWLLLSSGGVDSVNTKVGIVTLNSDDIGEGANKYFASGVSDYKASVASGPNELAKLDTNGYI